MKLVVLGLGQCGGRIADEFARLSRKAHVQRSIDIIAGAFAINTDVADLSGLTTIRPDFRHRILIGSRKTGGHGVGKINELGAEIAKEDGDKVIDTLRTGKHFIEADAFLLIASAAGGTGSGSISVMTRRIKEIYVDKPVYNLIVLPFEHEEITEERTIYNSATCLKSAYLVADAVFLVDNQRFIRKDSSVIRNLHRINSSIAEPFYNLLCAGEEKRPKYIGAKILDAGDIIQTLAGWTTIGYGQSRIPFTRLLASKIYDFRFKASESQRGIHTIDEAMSALSLKCNPSDARRALYLVSAPASEMNIDLIKEIGTYLKGMAPDAVIRSGDYPRSSGTLNITVIISELGDIEKIRGYFAKTLAMISTKKKTGVDRSKGIEVSLKDIPSLL